jgi:DNA-binding beta-propeller fold protein YncE
MMKVRIEPAERPLKRSVKKTTVSALLLLSLAVVLVFVLIALPRLNARPKPNPKKPVKLLGGILLPGNPLRFDISWVDQATGRYYLAEAGNAAVDVIDAENDLYLGRITGFHGLGLPDDTCGAIEGMGPNGVLVTPNNQLWADDAHGTVKVFDLNKAEPPFTNVMPIATISTGAHCRADEIGFDPKDHLIIVGNPEEKPPYASIISSDPPYTVLGKVPFEGARGFEQPMWDPELKGGRMLATVPGMGETSKVVVFNLKDPKSPSIEATYPTGNCGSGLVLGPSQHLLVGCGGGKPLIVIDALTGKMIASVDGTKGADEVWYNPGDNSYYAPAGFGGMPTLSVIDAATNKLLNNLPAGPGSHSVAAYRENNHIFVPIAIPTNAAPTDACNVMFGLPEKRGCIAVYAHEN